MKKILLVVALLITTLLTTACGGDKKSEVLKVGVNPGPHAEIMEVVKKVAEKDGLKIQIVEFSDFVQPNVALHQNDIQVNSFQHKPYMDAMVKDRKYDIHWVANTIVFPIGIYSKNIKSINDVPEGAIVGIPNDPTNGARSLMLLERQNLIKLKQGADLMATPSDIIANPKNIKIKELDAALIPRSLEDLTLATINTTYALSAGLAPDKDALALEDANSMYVNILATNGKSKDDPRVKALVKAYQSKEVKDYVENKYKKSMICAW